ncbi:MAG: DNA polymerase III subunit alpha, partial [Clostridia bacterium]|nr:DNA polymerase III subunit alpha [Clostridia bacterium]
MITEHPVSHYVPLSLGGDTIVTQYDMDAVSELGLVKFDFLGLRYLTILKDAENEVREGDPEFSLEKIPLDDKATYKMISDGDTSGVFQLESGGMRQMLTQLEPNSLEEITAAIALYRPGPMDSIPTFIARKHGRETVNYELPVMKDILSVTYGCIVYQEQVMQIFRALAGYSLARADLVRRAMSKKKADVLEAERERFLAGCSQNAIPAELAGKIFDDMASFANYAFNKSHATAYAVTTYRTAYLKRHYPAAYFCALLTSVLGSAPKVAEYIGQAHKRGIRVLPPDINESRMYFHVHGGNIRFGLLALKNVGVRFVEQLIAEREANGPFTSFESFLSRMADGELGKRQVESLIKSGSFDSFLVFRSQLLSSYEELIDTVLNKKRGNVAGQLDIFSALLPDTEETHEYPDIPEFTTRELLLLEKESSGMYFSGHLLDDYKEDIEREACDGISEILSAFEEGEAAPAYKERDKVTVCGMITSKTVKNT